MEVLVMQRKIGCLLTLLFLSIWLTACSDEGASIPAADLERPNPYENMYFLGQWRYDVFELYRGAEKVEFSETLSYERVTALDERLYRRFEVSLPQVAETSPFFETFNRFYCDKYQELQGNENLILDNHVSGTVRQHSLTHSITVLYAYTWENTLSVIIEETQSDSRTVSELIVDNFDLNTGRRLTLDDVFTVSDDIYSERILSSIRIPDIANPPILFPPFDDSLENIPMPTSENFLLTPNGLALIYKTNEIASRASGTVILFVDYGDLSDILALNLY